MRAKRSAAPVTEAFFRSLMGAPKKRSKYGAIPTEVNGIRFASKKEARRYQELRLLEMAGEITDLRVQPRWPLWAHDIENHPQVVGTYVADFAYEDQRGKVVVEDVKGVRTALYRWKKKHVEAQYQIEIVEV